MEPLNDGKGMETQEKWEAIGNKALNALNKHKSPDRNELLPKVLREFAMWTLLIRVTCIITENKGDVENLDIRKVA